MAVAARPVIVLLRGINVGGKNKLPMADLRAIAADCGYSDAVTYIQSGNLVLPSTPDDLEGIRSGIGAAITERTGLEISLILRTAAEWDAVIAANPFPEAVENGKHLHVIFLAERAPDELVSFDPDPFAPEDVAVREREVYLHTPDGMGRSKLAIAVNRLPGASTGTARNWNTVVKLADLATSG